MGAGQVPSLVHRTWPPCPRPRRWPGLCCSLQRCPRPAGGPSASRTPSPSSSSALSSHMPPLGSLLEPHGLVPCPSHPSAGALLACALPGPPLLGTAGRSHVYSVPAPGECSFMTAVTSKCYGTSPRQASLSPCPGPTCLSPVGSLPGPTRKEGQRKSAGRHWSG